MYIRRYLFWLLLSRFPIARMHNQCNEEKTVQARRRRRRWSECGTYLKPVFSTDLPVPHRVPAWHCSPPVWKNACQSSWCQPGIASIGGSQHQLCQNCCLCWSFWFQVLSVPWHKFQWQCFTSCKKWNERMASPESWLVSSFWRVKPNAMLAFPPLCDSLKEGLEISSFSLHHCSDYECQCFGASWWQSRPWWSWCKVIRVMNKPIWWWFWLICSRVLTVEFWCQVPNVNGGAPGGWVMGAVAVKPDQGLILPALRIGTTYTLEFVGDKGSCYWHLNI